MTGIVTIRFMVRGYATGACNAEPKQSPASHACCLRPSSTQLVVPQRRALIASRFYNILLYNHTLLLFEDLPVPEDRLALDGQR